MHRTRYTDEIGLDSGERIVPRSCVAVILAIVAVGAWFGAAALREKFERRHEADRLAAAAAAPERTVLARK